MDVKSFLAHLDSGSPDSASGLVHVQDVSAREPRFAATERPLHPDLEATLQAAGVGSLYSHQAEAVDAARRGENVIVSTPAASGKSLCYHLPVLDALLDDKSARAIYLFPTKALTQDQARSLGELVPESSAVRADIFDGDTPTSERAAIRRGSRIVLTNPDMLHLGILPNHRAWHQVLRGLKFVVIDEAHMYRGVFGSHVANVIRRLRRLCLRVGSSPQFILCTATIGNPSEHAERLVGLPFKVVDDDGAPFGGKDFAFWNPPMIDEAEGSRRSTNSESAQIMTALMRRKVRTMAFVRSRRTAELLYMYVRDRLKESNPELAGRLSPYRASYLPQGRRRIEQDLFSGRLLGLTTTNAMELGIDVGDLDATIISGYPGTIASTWQQAGRSGRSGDRALSVMVALDNPLDQYLMRHPETFFGRTHESARISPANPYVLKPHLLCAAYEAPLVDHDAGLFGIDLAAEAGDLVADGLLDPRDSRGSTRWFIAPDLDYPAQQVNIRSSSGSFYTLVDRDSGVILETVEESTAFLQLHPGGVYLHQGEPYLITDLDLESHTADAVKADVPYYTESRDRTDTRIISTLSSKRAGETDVYFGEVAVTTRVIGFRRRSHMTGEVLGEEYVELPPQTYNTTSLWFDVPGDTLDYILDEKMDLAGGLHAAEHAAIGVLPLFAMCDRNDIGGISTPLHPDTGRPQVFIHDGHPGGVGISEHGYEVIEDLWRATLEVISTCTCTSGCPSCVHSPKCGNNNQPLDKDVAVLLLEAMLGGRRE